MIEKRLPVAGMTLQRRIVKSFGKGAGSVRSKHTASSPGNSPNVQSGDLMRSITVGPVQRTSNSRFIAVGINAGPVMSAGTSNKAGPGDYGYWLEYGTSKMAARPFMRPAAEWMKSGNRLARILGS